MSSMAEEVENMVRRADVAAPLLWWRPAGTFYFAHFSGPGVPARMSITTGGVTRAATVYALAGHPGSAVGVLWLPPQVKYPGPEFTIAVYDAHGRVLVILRPNLVLFENQPH
ncbi:hypothetical protein ABH931_001935 [Streptacidiphilus sp. MAP12-33]|uniref:hypothetical protein n=1 Tax=Streptacidiphilus sp. MAP12-33 TaxID=3156266 RepID=UPI003519677E